MGKAERWTVVLPEEGGADFEAVCEAVHDAWWAEKKRQGVADHPDMVPYAQLAEDKKDYDRATVRAVLEGLRRQARKTAGRIRPGDVVLYRPSGEEWVVCGVNYEKDGLVPCGYPFPSMGKISDCELLEARGLPQDRDMVAALRKVGMDSYIEEV